MMPLHPPGSSLADALDADLVQIERLDELGYDEARIGEHFTAEWENIPAPDLFIAAALQRTRRMLLGTRVSYLPNHDPFMLAHRIAQLDQMARGRFMFGVGSSGFPGDFAVAGIDPKGGAQRDLTNDAIDVILKLWESPEPGRYRQHRWDFTVPTPDPVIARNIHVAETTEQARREAIDGAIGRDFRDYFIPLMTKTRRRQMTKVDPAMPDDAVTPEYLIDNVWIVGDPEECVRQIRALYDRVGGFGTLLALAHDWPDLSVWDRSMTLFATEVMPRLADLTGESAGGPTPALVGGGARGGGGA